jgi:protein-disulfide isomerase
VIAVLFFGAAASAVALFPREGIALEPQAQAPSPVQEADRLAAFDRWYAAQPRVPIMVPTEGAKVLIVDFSDFQCPFCKQAYDTLKPILAKYNAEQPGAVRLVLKDYPLDSKCNPNVQNGGPHPSACEAAVAVRLAKARNRDEALAEWLFANQPSMTSETVRKAAREIGQVTDFQEKYAATIELVKGDIAFGKTLNVSGTPNMFINGVKISGALEPQFMTRAISLELQRATAK